MNPLMQSIGGNNANIPSNFSQIANIAKMISSGDPRQIAASLMQKNPQFKAFVETNRGKTPEQVAKEHGIDINQIVNMIK